MDKLTFMRGAVAPELDRYIQMFDEALAHDDDYLGSALDYIRRRKGKMMRPVLVLLMAKELGEVADHSVRAAVTLELLHTASLVHDDVVDESAERRGQRSVNSVFDNKVAVLVGDYLLSASLLAASQTANIRVVEIISRLGGTLSKGELFQLSNIRNEQISEEAYYRIIEHKTAALFSACARLGALSAGGTDEYVERAARFGELVGVCFQIRDDIFDYFQDSAIGKPTGNDMREGKLTLPAIHALQTARDPQADEWARHVKAGTATPDEIGLLVEFTKAHGGIEYAEERMQQLRREAHTLLQSWSNPEIKAALAAYIDYVAERTL